MRTATRYLKIISTLLLPIAVASCGGGGGGLPPLGGNLNVAGFTIPAGQTQTVTSDLTVNSTGPILIAGTLLVPPGVSARFLSLTSLSVTGAISAPIVKSAQLNRASRLGSAPAQVVISARTVEIRGDAKLAIGISFTYAGLSKLPELPTLNISGNVTAGSGTDSLNPGIDGGAGGSVELGTAKALGDVNTAFPKLPPGFAHSQPVTATITGSLSGGTGGKGYTDAVGAASALLLTLTGTNGGKGGDCNIAADTIDLTGATIIAGNGGQGGGGGDLVASHPHAHDGTLVAEAGADVHATSGDGGNGGSISVTSPRVTGATGTAGQGGGPGSIYASPGYGGPGGNGGSAFADVGKLGTAGTAPNPPVNKPDLANVDVHLGGNGGGSATAGLSGGRGGNATISARPGGTAKGLVKSISLLGFGKGGAGYNGCSASPPVSGTSGGNGGLLTVFGAGYSDAVFNAGNGGDGCGPGAGGKGGTDDAGKKIGNDGASGAICTNCPHASAFDAGSYYPLRTGDKYTYLYGFTGGTLSSDLTIGAATNIPGIAAPVVAETYFVGGAKSETAFVNSTSRAPIGVQQYGGDYYDQTGAIVQRVRYTPEWLIPQGLGLGQSNSQSITQVNSQPGNPDATQSYTLRTTLVSFEDITVPAGTYFGCAKVLTEFLSSTGTLFSSTNSWYAPGVGLVKNMDTVGDSQVLTAYVPAKSARR